MIKIDDNIIEGMCDLHSREVKKLIAMEELGELIQAISKGRRDELTSGVISHEHHANEMEEVADVLLICKSLMYLDGLDEDIIQAWVDYKQRRQMFRDYQFFKKADMYPDDDPTQIGDHQELASYFLKCKEVFDEYNGDEAKVKDDVPQI